MFPRLATRLSVIHGWGVFALEDIPVGDLVLPIDDSRVVTPECPLDEACGEFPYHCDYLANNETVLFRPPERHINHHCVPNVYVRTIIGKRFVFALQAIASGEEITFDYCINGYGDTLWKCNCGSPDCRKLIHSDFFHLPTSLQLKYMQYLDIWYMDEFGSKVEDLLKSAR